MLKTLKFLSLFLCLTLLLFSVVRPIQVNASAAATITIGVASGASASVAIPVAIIAVILVGIGYLVDNFDELVMAATEIYNTASTSVKQWLDESATKIQNGIQRITIVQPGKAHIIEYINNNPTPNGWDKGKIALLTFAAMFIFPKVLSALDKLKPEEVFSSEIVEAVEENTSVLIQIKGALGSLRNTIETSFHDIGLSLDSVSSNIVEMKNAVVEWTGNVNQSVSTFGRSLSEWIGNLNANVVHYGKLQLEWLGTVNVSLGNIRDDIVESLEDLNADQREWTGHVNSSLGTVADRVTSSVDLVNQHLAPYIDSSLGFAEGSQQILNDFKNNVSNIGNSLEVDFNNLKTTVNQVGTNLELDLNSIKTSVNNVGTDIETELNSIDGTLETWGGNIQDWTKNVNSNVVTYGKSTVQWLQNINSNLVSSTTKLGTQITNAINPPSAKPDTSIVDNAQSQEQNIISGITGSIDNTAGYFTDAGSVLNANLNNFLAAGLIFNVFANVPFIQQLLIISVSIGIVGALLGIALSAAGRDRSDARKKENYKGGVVLG